MINEFTLAGKAAAVYFAGSAVVFLVICVATSVAFTRRERNFTRAVVFALLLTPVGFGVHDTAIFLFPVAALLTFSWLSLVTLGLMIVVGGIVYALLSALPDNATPVRETGLIAIALLVCATIIGVATGIDAHRERQKDIEWRETAVIREQERIRTEASDIPTLPFTQNAGGVIMLPRPAEISQDYLLTPPANNGVLKFSVNDTLASNEIISVRNPRNLDWTVVTEGGVSALTVQPGDVLLVMLEHTVKPARPTGLLGAERLDVQSTGNDERVQNEKSAD